METARRLATWIVLALATVALAACSAAPRFPDPVIDGLPIGDPLACRPEAFYDCEELIAIGQAALDRRAPDHPAVAHAWMADEGDASFGFGETVSDRSASLDVAVFELEDGTVRAVGVVCSIGSCWALDP